MNVVVLTKDELETVIHQAAMTAVNEALSRIPAKPVRPIHVNQTQAAKMLGMSRPTLSKMIKAGKIKLNDCGLIPIETIDTVSAIRKNYADRPETRVAA